MLKGISKLVSPEMLKLLSEMGHGDELILSDAHFPACSQGVPVIRADGSDVPSLLEAILPIWELDTYVDHPAVMMSAVPGDHLDEAFVAEVSGILKKHGVKQPIGYIERFAFYDRAKKVSAVIVTGETHIYGNLLLKKGVIHN